MKMKPFGYVGVGVVIGCVVGAFAMNIAGTSTVNAASKSEIEAVVREYIASHGDEVMAGIQTAVTRQQMAQIEKVVDDSTPTRGPKDAPITIIEFSDFECPFCSRVQPNLAEISAKYGNKIRWAYKNLPLGFHEEARPAAYAALAAHNQGKFWEYGDQLWAKQTSLGEKTYVAIAEGLKLDMAKFNKDRASDATKAIVDKDLQDAEAVGARGTPHFLINGEAISGALPAAEFAKIIDAKLAQAKK